MAIRTDFAAGEVLAAADLNDTFGAKLNLAGGKILQIVRATDGTNRTTTSTSFVDASISVTITPQKDTSAVLLIWSFAMEASQVSTTIFQIATSANAGVVGAQADPITTAGINYANKLVLFAWDAPATTSAVTYKGRFRNAGAETTTIRNGSNSTGQLFAIEVSA